MRATRTLAVLVVVGSTSACGSEAGGRSGHDAGNDAASDAVTAPDASGGDADVVEDTAIPTPATACVPTAVPPPYPPSSPSLGVQAGPANNDLVDCATTELLAIDWHVLQGRGVAQPNTFSPDGSVTYVTASPRTEDPCTVFAIEAATGSIQWCQPVAGAIVGSVTGDDEGSLYVAGEGAVISLEASGRERWSTPFVAPDGSPAGPTGLHLHPTGHVAVAAGNGVFALLDRADGSTVASLDVYDAFGFPRVARPGLALDLASLLPEPVVDDFVATFGSLDRLLDVFSGAGTLWTDNTIGIAPDGTLYAIGTGLDDTSGALVQVRVGTASTLEPGWWLATRAGSAASPSISPDGRWLKVTDGNGTQGLLNPSAADASAYIVDIEACDANTDSDPDELRCAARWVVPLRSGPALGASPILNDGEHYAWDVQLAALFENDVPDVTRYSGDTVVWETTLPDDAVWSSVITLSQNHVIGTVSRFTPSDERLLAIPLPGTIESELVLLDRASGALRFRAPITDDSTSTVTVGPDGALYVTQLGLLNGFAIETTIVGGVVRYAPTEPESPNTGTP